MRVKAVLDLPLDDQGMLQILSGLVILAQVIVDQAQVA